MRRRRFRRAARSAARVIMMPARRVRRRASRVRARFAFRRRAAGRSFSIPLLSWAIGLYVIAQVMIKLAQSDALTEFRRGWIRGVRQTGEERDLRGMTEAWGDGVMRVGKALASALPVAIGGGLAIGLARAYLRRWSTTVRVGPVAIRTLS